MAIVKMKKLSLSVYDSSREELLSDLQKAGCYHLENANETPTTDEEESEKAAEKKASPINPITLDSSEVDQYINDLEDCIEFLDEFVVHEKKGLMDSLGAVPPSVSFERLKTVYGQLNIAEMIGDIRLLEKDFKDTESRLQTRLKERSDLIAWKDSGLDLDIINGRSDFLDGFAGFVPITQYDDFIERLRSTTPFVEPFTAFSDGSNNYLYLVFLKGERSLVMNFLKNTDFNMMLVSHRVGSIDFVVHDLKQEIDNLRARSQFNRALILDYTEYLDGFKSVYDYLLVKKQRMEAEEKGGKTESVSFYEGWIPANRQKDIEKIFSKYDDVDYELADPKPEEMEDVPVQLHSSNLTVPFEGLTRMYGLPVYGKTMDPTAHLAPFYFIFYGFCLGDVFYGLIMFLLFGFMARKSRNNPGTSAFMRMLSLVGISSFIFGFIFRSYLGDLFVNPNYLRIDFLANIGLIDTMQRPLLVLFISFILGSIHLLYGVFLNMVQKMKENTIDGLFDNLPVIVFLLGFFSWADFVWLAGLADIPQAPANIVRIFYYLMMGGAGLIVINAVRNGAKKGIGKAIVGLFGGVYELYGTVTGYLSDLLSYARLLALGLSTGVIAGVFNYLAFDMIYHKMPPAIGIPLTVILLIFGHIFNLVLSAFGAFVHSMRLQFVEFFGKFLTAGGKEFEPLGQDTLYHTIKTDEKSSATIE